MRALLLPPVRFVGAGAGEAGWITERGGQALTEAGVCLYDALIDTRLLLRLPAGCERVPVGKRRGAHSRSQDEICALIAEYARRGRRLVRLKGGDPGIFGRLSEELAVLDQMGFPHLVYPGLSALSLATTGTGLFLTKRGKSRGFRALTPKRSSGHESVPTAFPANEDLPAALFMSLSEAAAAREHFLKEGLPPDTDCAVVYDAGTAWEEIRRCPLNQLGRPPIPPGRVGLILLNPPEGMPYRRSGPLAGDRVLLTCSEELLDRARAGVEDAGGRALLLPLIRQELIEGSLPSPEEIAGYDWVILTSPTAIRLFLTSYRTAGGDYRQLPKIMVCGSSSAAVLAAHGLKPDLIPPHASDSQALAESAKAVIQPGQRILRLRSDAAGTKLTEALSALGAEIKDAVFYRTAADTSIGRCPPFEAVFFASSSAVRAYLELWGIDSLADKTILTIGRPTRQTLESLGLKGVLTADQSDARGSIAALAIEYFRRKVEQYGFS